MMLESIANEMRLVAYTDVRVFDELGDISYPSARCCFLAAVYAFLFKSA